MDSMDEMDLMLMQQPSHDKENGVAFSLSPGPHDARGASSNALKFHLVSQEDHGGYMVSVSQTRVRHLRNILVDSGLYAVDSEAACNKILRKASKVKSKTQGVRLVLEKQDFDSAMRSIFAGMTAKGEMSAETQRTLSDLLAFIFRSFDHDRSGKVDATELACGFTVLCDGKKSDKLEYAFELMDMNRNGKLDRSRVCSYLQSFLTVLLCVTTSSHLRSNSLEDSILYMNGRPCSGDHVTMERAADSGSDWAATQAFKGCYSGRKEENYLNFDDFAEWYTRKGFSCIPWLELLDLRKWVITE
jgi:Ca2+-binding EF-hand superfamily protein